MSVSAKQIQWLIENKCGNNASEMARILDVSEGTIRNWRKGKDIPSASRRKIADVFKVTEEWLVFGIEDTEVTPVATGESNDKVIYINLVNVTVGAGNGHVVWSEEVLEKMPLTELFFRVNGIRSNPADLTAVTVDGDSMMPYLLPGDIVMVDHSQTAPSEGVFVVRSHDSVLIKRLQPMIDGRIRIFSFNADYEPDFVDPNSPDFCIIGRVVWGGRRF